MELIDGASVTESPRFKRGFVRYASAPPNSPIRGDYGFPFVLGVGATLSACRAPPSTHSQELQEGWDYEAGRFAIQGEVADFFQCFIVKYNL